METKAYHNFDVYLPVAQSRNTSKWIQAAREIYYKIHKGANHNEAFDNTTKDWDDMERFDFKNWLRFYEGGEQNKYKQAQFFWGDQNPGYFVPLQQERKHEMDVSTMTNPSTHPDVVQDEKRKIIEKQRQKIIGRLDSAEKLLRTHEGQMFAGNEYEQLVEILYQLKKKIQMVNKISTSVTLYQNMIVREANIMSARGHKEASSFLTKIAQALPSAAEAPNPASIGEGQAGTLPGQAPGQVSPGNTPPVDITMPEAPLPGVSEVQNTPEQMPPQEDLSPGMKQFLEGLDTANKSVSEDEEEEGLHTQAQVLPTEPAMEVQEDPEVIAGKDFDTLLDNTFANITVTDVVAKLEDLVKIFKTREIPRQLAIVDLMLDRLGLVSFFPSLAEASNKSLESNQYMLTRVEDVLSKLRGTMTTRELDLKNESPAPVGQAALLTKQKLQEEDVSEKAKKKMRKDIEEQKLMKPEPEIEVTEDLGQPAELAAAPPMMPPATPTPPPAPEVVAPPPPGPIPAR